MSKTKKVYRDAKTGKFVSPSNEAAEEEIVSTKRMGNVLWREVDLPAVAIQGVGALKRALLGS